MAHTAVYNTASWRDLPRELCLASELLGEAVGPCRGVIHRHHVNPDDPDSRTVELCAAHHSRVHAVLRSLTREPRIRRCPHRHVTPEARAACERRLNGSV